MKTRFCVVGSPIEHSLSPVLHAAAYKYLGLDFDYQKSLVGLGELESFLDTSKLAGVSVTMPLKQEAFSLAANHDKYALATRVANTLIKGVGDWSAANTDVYGITKALADVPTPMRTVVIGSGATARSALVALSELFAETQISIISRNQEKGLDLLSFAQALGFGAQLELPSAEVLLNANLVMSLVPAGSFAQLWSDFAQVTKAEKSVLFDVAYNPWPSEAAVAWNPDKVISGIEMLIWQAIEQVQLFVTASGLDMQLDRNSLYEVMKSAVSGK